MDTQQVQKTSHDLSTLTPTINKTYRRQWLSAVGATVQHLPDLSHSSSD